MKTPDGRTHPLWYDRVAVPEPAAPVLPRGPVDACVVGAGIAGLTTAYLLAKEGKRVVVLDEGAIGSGQTGRTSAHLASATDDRFTEMERMHGERGARLAYESHAAAIALIESIAASESIDCELARIPGYLMAARPEDRPELDRELEAARKTGIDAEWIDRLPLGATSVGPCLRFGRQARFHPLKYLVGLAQACERAGATILGGVRVHEVHGGMDSAPAHAVIGDGRERVVAPAIVVATNTPGPIKEWAGVYFKQHPYRTYVIGIRIPRGAIEDALYWDTLDPYHYVRLEAGATGEPDDVLVVGGEDHGTGHFPSDRDPFAELERWARGVYPDLGAVVARWSGQVQEPTDGLGFIGRAPTKGEGVYVVTGDSGMGLTHGTLGARLIADLVLGRPNEWAELYDPERKPTHSVRTFVAENVGAATGFLELVTPGDASDASAIAPGCGAVIRKGLGKLAVYRDEQGALHECSAVCPHLGAIVQWNPIERSWDCPAHGSRFSATGALLVGPAVDDLERKSS